jgi:Xaa-Pro dipeptidase
MTFDQPTLLGTDYGDDERLAALIAAQNKALALLTVIRERGLIAPGRTEHEIEHDILRIAEDDFGVKQNWHKRIVRAGKNTLAVFAENPPVLMVQSDDVVFLDLGPVFGTWEADVGETIVLGQDPKRHALVDELPIQFGLIRDRLLSEPDITGAELYSYACDRAVSAGYKFGGQIAGHIVAEFPHLRLSGDRQAHHISPANPLPLSNLDPNGHRRHWIIEVHLVSEDGSFGGFYERLAVTD